MNTPRYHQPLFLLNKVSFHTLKGKQPLLRKQKATLFSIFFSQVNETNGSQFADCFFPVKKYPLITKQTRQSLSVKNNKNSRAWHMYSTRACSVLVCTYEEWPQELDGVLGEARHIPRVFHHDI